MSRRFAALALIPFLLTDLGPASSLAADRARKLENADHRANFPEFGSQALILSLTWAHPDLTNGFLHVFRSMGGLLRKSPAPRNADSAGASGAMPPSFWGRRSGAVLGWSPATEEWARGLIWGIFGISGAWIFGVLLVFAHWPRYYFKARQIYYVKKMPAMRGFPPAWSSMFGRTIYVMAATMSFSAAMMLAAMWVFHYLGSGDPKARQIWWIPATVNWVLHIFAGVVWKFLFEDRVKARESAVMPASLWGAA